MAGCARDVVFIYGIEGATTSLIFSAIDAVATICNSPRGVPGLLHHTDVVAASSSVSVVTPCCDAAVYFFSPSHCWAGGPPPADVGHSSPNRSHSSGRVCSGWLNIVQVDCRHTGCSSSTRYPWRSWWSGRARETITTISPTERLPKGAGMRVVVDSSGVNCREGV